MRGALTTEVMTLDGSLLYAQSVNAFESVTGITTSGLSVSLSVTMHGRDGSNQMATYTLVSDYPAQVFDRDASFSATKAGGRAQSGGPRITIPWTDTWAPREGDLFTDDLGRVWESQSDGRSSGTTVAEAWHIRIKRHEVRA